MPKPPEPINDTYFEAELFGGDKVEIGDKGSTDFKPHIKLNRWDGECFIKVGLPIKVKGSFTIEGNKIKWSTTKLEAYFYPLNPKTIITKDKEGKDVEFTQNELGGFEFEIILKKKPVTNKIVLNIETQGLKFYHQPPLTQEEIADGSVRPDNVIGSYAVYHATRTNMHRGKKDAEKYKCGIAFHIYRPKITDSEGNWIWGELTLDEKVGTLTTIIPQDFLDNAIYPVSIDPNFGYETGGSSTHTMYTNYWAGSLFTSPSDFGTVSSMTAYLLNASKYAGRQGWFKGTIVNHSDLTIVADGVSNESTKIPGGDYVSDWVTAIYGTAPTVSPTTAYVLSLIMKQENPTYYIYLWYNTGDADQGHNETDNNYDSPTNPSSITHSTKKFSIYCTYEAVAGWTHKYLGVANASIAKINGVAIADIVKVNGVA